MYVVRIRDFDRTAALACAFPYVHHWQSYSTDFGDTEIDPGRPYSHPLFRGCICIVR